MPTSPAMSGPPTTGTPPEEFGPYLVYESLGAGGMATVHRAVQRGIEGFDRTVALKRLLPEFAHNDDFVRSFVREARIASQLRHINCAQTYDLGRVGDTFYIAMELVVGNDLRRILRQTATVTGPMPVPLTINILIQLCDALEYAHNLHDESGEPMGIIHRDVSPANVIVARDGTAKLIDFGIAKASAANLATMSGQLKGKFAYMAPENLTGNIDARLDLFAIGVIAHELLTARPLFAGGQDDFETLKRVRTMPIVPPSQMNPNVPPDLDTIALTALARDPEERWQSAAAMRGALMSLVRGAATRAEKPDVAAWLRWAFAQPNTMRTGTAPIAIAASPSQPVRVQPESDAGATITDDIMTVSADDELLDVEENEVDEDAADAPARTLMFGSGIIPVVVAPRISGPIAVQPMPSRTPTHQPVVRAPLSASQPVVAVPARMSAESPAQPVGQTMVMVEDTSSATRKFTDAAVALPPTPSAQPDSAIPVAVPAYLPTEAVQIIPHAPMPIWLIIVACLVAAAIGFVVVTALT